MSIVATYPCVPCCGPTTQCITPIFPTCTPKINTILPCPPVDGIWQYWYFDFPNALIKNPLYIENPNTACYLYSKPPFSCVVFPYNQCGFVFQNIATGNSNSFTCPKGTLNYDPTLNIWRLIFRYGPGGAGVGNGAAIAGLPAMAEYRLNQFFNFDCLGPNTFDFFAVAPGLQPIEAASWPARLTIYPIPFPAAVPAQWQITYPVITGIGIYTPPLTPLTNCLCQLISGRTLNLIQFVVGTALPSFICVGWSRIDYVNFPIDISFYVAQNLVLINFDTYFNDPWTPPTIELQITAVHPSPIQPGVFPPIICHDVRYRILMSDFNFFGPNVLTLYRTFIDGGCQGFPNQLVITPI